MSDIAEGSAVPMRTLEVRTRSEGVFRIDIPRDWKITFSRVNPAGGGYDTLALRVYESDDKQRACFTDVVSFRDLSIPVRRRVKRSKEETKSERGPKKTAFQVETTLEHEWVEEDE